jgi:hypothetical protein
MFDGNRLVCGSLMVANHGYRSSRVKELDQIFQKNQPARSRCHLEGISHGVAPLHRFLPIRHRLRTGTLFSLKSLAAPDHGKILFRARRTSKPNQ